MYPCHPINKGKEIGLLVNNAGIASVGSFLEQEPNQAARFRRVDFGLSGRPIRGKLCGEQSLSVVVGGSVAF